MNGLEGQMDYFAHLGHRTAWKEPVIDHLKEVARLCSEFASRWGASEEGYIAGLLHDIGKYSGLFQDVLNKQAIHVDHATPGSLVVLTRYRNAGFAAALAIEGHHEGLRAGVAKDGSQRMAMHDDISSTGRRYSERDWSRLVQRFIDGGGSFPSLSRSGYFDVCGRAVPAMLYIRMLFSALTDADFLATEAFFNGRSGRYAYRRYGLRLGAERAHRILNRLLEYMKELRLGSKAKPEVNSLRDDLFEACLRSGGRSQGIYTLRAPTGAGKTLSMLALALGHVREHDLDRIIFVLPFLNIIEDMAKRFRTIVSELGDDVFVLEDHSLSEAPDGSDLRMLAENWDAPIVITTTVKFFDSLFSNRSTSCRRLHNIVRSVILFDEAQTMPPGLAPVTLAALSELQRRYGCTVVFSTATQPAFDTLSDQVKQYAFSGWSPAEIVPDDLRLFDRAKRVRVVWHRECLSWEELVGLIAVHKQALAIVNLRSHAREIYSSLKAFEPDSTYHLSTDMCPAHRIDVLECVRERLENGESCRLVSTQCVEAGVDIDFPTVFRSIAPLEAIVQAAGRCNRNGRADLGTVHVFTPSPDKERYPTTDYEKGAVEVKGLLKDGDIDIYSTEILKEYYRRYYSFIGIQSKNPELHLAISALDFEETDRRYEWIPTRGVNVLVPYRARIEEFQRLCDAARNGQIDSQWLIDARPLSVNSYLNPRSVLGDYLEPITDRDGTETGWYILVDSRVYSDRTGIDLSASGIDDHFIIEEANG